MEDTSLGSLSLFGMAVCLATLNLVIIIQDLSSFLPCIFHFFTNSLLFTWAPNKKRGSNPPAESEASCHKRKAGTIFMSTNENTVSIEEVTNMIDNAETFYGHEELFESEVSMEEVKEAFRVFDVDGDGFVVEEELRRVICALGFDMCSKEECREMIRVVDENNDGKVDICEFVKLLEKSFS